jgi:hypothetical protein
VADSIIGLNEGPWANVFAGVEQKAHAILELLTSVEYLTAPVEERSKIDKEVNKLTGGSFPSAQQLVQVMTHVSTATSEQVLSVVNWLRSMELSAVDSLAPPGTGRR